MPEKGQIFISNLSNVVISVTRFKHDSTRKYRAKRVQKGIEIDKVIR